MISWLAQTGRVTNQVANKSRLCLRPKPHHEVHQNVYFQSRDEWEDNRKAIVLPFQWGGTRRECEHIGENLRCAKNDLDGEFEEMPFRLGHMDGQFPTGIVVSDGYLKNDIFIVEVGLHDL